MLRAQQTESRPIANRRTMRHDVPLAHPSMQEFLLADLLQAPSAQETRLRGSGCMWPCAQGSDHVRVRAVTALRTQSNSQHRGAFRIGWLGSSYGLALSESE